MSHKPASTIDGILAGHTTNSLCDNLKTTQIATAATGDECRQVKPDVLYLCHCAPTLPDKGERIRAYHEVQYLARRYRVHVAGFAREARVLDFVDAIQPLCASIHLELLRAISLPRKALGWLLGESLTARFYESAGLRSYIRTLAREVRFSAAVAFSSPMARYAPHGIPLLLDMVDVDSEKWAEYARRRSPGWLYAIEARRLRRLERVVSRNAGSVLLTTEQESAVLRRIAPECRIHAVENGVDFGYFDPHATPRLPELENRPFIVMVGAMNYFPNADAAVWFAREVFPAIRSRNPGIDFLIVGHSPLASVERLGGLPGVTVTGYVPDVRPYIAQAATAVTPLRIARGVQNKVLEALAMGKPVLGSPEVGRTFGESLPPGVEICRDVEDYVHRALEHAARGCGSDSGIRQAARDRFSWDSKLDVLDRELRFVMRAASPEVP